MKIKMSLDTKKVKELRKIILYHNMTSEDKRVPLYNRYSSIPSLFDLCPIAEIETKDKLEMHDDKKISFCLVALPIWFRSAQVDSKSLYAGRSSIFSDLVSDGLNSKSKNASMWIPHFDNCEDSGNEMLLQGVFDKYYSSKKNLLSIPDDKFFDALDIFLACRYEYGKDVAYHLISAESLEKTINDVIHTSVESMFVDHFEDRIKSVGDNFCL